MIIKLDDYDLGRKIVSLALSDEVAIGLKDRDLNVMQLEKEHIYLRKENLRIPINEKVYKSLCNCNNYDVFQIDYNGNAYRFYNSTSIDNVFMLTGKCNSNCIMCPAADSLRKHGRHANMKEILEIIKHIPSDAKHLTITGGEPFLVGNQIFIFFQELKHKFKQTEFLLLTNGRAFSLKDYVEKFNDTAPKNTLVGIPIHGHNSSLHDKITQTHGSFRQTMFGIKNLLQLGRKVEIRIVVSKLNYNELYNIAKLITANFSDVDSVKIMGMEMTGNAAVNRDKLWLTYHEAFKASKLAINELVNKKIDVALYNFPLCAVDKPYRMLCRKSITDYKIKYADVCNYCDIKDACGGIFNGSFSLAKEDVIPEVIYD